MSVALPLSTIVPEQLAGLRADQAAGAVQGGQEGFDKNASEFTTLLSELNGEGIGLADRLPAPISGAEPQYPRDDGGERWAKAEAPSTEASASPDVSETPHAAVNAPVVDPSLSMLLMGFPNRPAAPASDAEPQESNAERTPSGRSTSASALSQYDKGGEAPSGVDPARPMSLDQALAAAARPATKATDLAVEARSSVRTPSSVVEESAPPPTAVASPPSTATAAESAAYSSVESVLAATARPKSEEVAGDVKNARSTTAPTSREEAPSRTTSSGARGVHHSSPESSLSPNPAPAVGAKAESESSAGEGAPETIRDVKIQSLETHLPVALSNILVAQVRSGFDVADAERPNVNIEIAPASIALGAQRQSAGPTKLLTIELEPASLGAITVKMKMSHSNIDMQIRVESMEALRALDATRDKLVDAMQSSGCTVDSCTIQVGATPAPDGSQSLAGGGGQSAASSGSDAGRQEHIGREGTNHGGQSGDPREHSGSGKENVSRDIAPRRSADRSGGVYL